MTGIIGFILIIANVIFSYKGFASDIFFDRYKFEVEKILIYNPRRSLPAAIRITAIRNPRFSVLTEYV